MALKYSRVSVNKLFKNKVLYVSILFLGIVGVTVLVIFAIGKAYQGGLGFLGNNAPQSVEVAPRKTIKKITIKKPDSLECLEVTPDGVVRAYTTCGEELSDAGRPADPTNVNKLVNLLRLRDLSKYKTRGPGAVYEIIIETDSGTETYYLPVDSGDDEVEEIIDVIEDIETSLTPSPTPQLNSPLPSVSSSLPPPGSSPGSSPSSPPTGGGGTADNPFICGFTETDQERKPVPVSNIICTSNPSPAPQP